MKFSILNSQSSTSNKSFTLIEVLVGIFLIVLVFMSIFGIAQLGLKVVAMSKTKTIATAIANGQIEKIRNLPYGSIGVKGGFPDGVLESATTTSQNNIQYTIENRVDYIIDLSDGEVPPQDDCPNDYKRVQVKVSWSGRFSGEIISVTDVAPKNLSQECSTGGGILSVSIFDAYGMMVPSPLIEIKDPTTDVTLKTATPIEGQYRFSLATSTYKVIISKDGYNTERTYGTDEVTTPLNPHPLVLEEQSTPISLSIDKLSNFSIDTLFGLGSDNFSDSFIDENKIFEKSDLMVNDGKVELATSSGGYLASGYLVSTEILPTTLLHWDELSFSDSKPTDTNIKYQIYYASGTDWYLIPDSDLSGNSVGFESSPVNLSDLSTTTYKNLKIRGNFSSASTTETPVLYDWQVSWVTSEATPIPNATFNLHGNKTIGKDSQDEPVYKYSATTTTNTSGHKDIQNLEWDLYTFSVAPATGLNLVNIQPSPQPVNLLPDTTSYVSLYLGAQNSLLVTVQDINNSEPIFSAAVRLYNTGLGYDQTQYTNTKGQTYFIPLEDATYNLGISCLGYLPNSTAAYVSGYKTKIVQLELAE